VTYTLRISGPDGLEVRFAPRPNALERLNAGGVDAGRLDSGELELRVDGRRGVELDLDNLRWGTVEEGPVRSKPRQGDPPTGLRVIRVEEVDDDTVRLVLEGRIGYVYRLPYWGSGPVIEEVDPVTVPVRDHRRPSFILITVTEEVGEPVGVDDYRRFTIQVDMH
jgi:hypothetical protein